VSCFGGVWYAVGIKLTSIRIPLSHEGMLIMVLACIEVHCGLKGDTNQMSAMMARDHLHCHKANQAWWGMYLILCHDGANSHTMAHFYLAVVQAKLIFGSETCVLTK